MTSLGYIERDPVNEYSFSNPVSDFAESAQNAPIIISPSNVPDNGQQLSLLDRNEIDGQGDSEYELLDAQMDANEAMHELESISKGILEDVTQIDEKTRAASDKLNALQLTPNQGRPRSQSAVSSWAIR